MDIRFSSDTDFRADVLHRNRSNRVADADEDVVIADGPRPYTIRIVSFLAAARPMWLLAMMVMR